MKSLIIVILLSTKTTAFLNPILAKGEKADPEKQEKALRMNILGNSLHHTRFFNPVFEDKEDIFAKLVEKRLEIKKILKHKMLFTAGNERRVKPNYETNGQYETFLQDIKNNEEVYLSFLKPSDFFETKLENKIIPTNIEEKDFLSLHPKVAEMGQLLAKSFIDGNDSDSDEDSPYYDPKEMLARKRNKSKGELMSAMKEIGGIRRKLIKVVRKRRRRRLIKIDAVGEKGGVGRGLDGEPKKKKKTGSGGGTKNKTGSSGGSGGTKKKTGSSGGSGADKKKKTGSSGGSGADKKKKKTGSSGGSGGTKKKTGSSGGSGGIKKKTGSSGGSGADKKKKTASGDNAAGADKDKTKIPESSTSTAAKKKKPPTSTSTTVKTKKPTKPTPSSSQTSAKPTKKPSSSTSTSQPATKTDKDKKPTPSPTAPEKDKKKQQAVKAKKPSNIVEEASVEGYHPIKIVYDNSLLMRSIASLKISKDDKRKIFNHINILIEKSDSFIRKYLLVKDMDAANSTVNLGRAIPATCGSDKYFNSRRMSQFKDRLEVNADVIVFVDVWDEDSDELAIASGCKKREDNRSSVGRLSLNVSNLRHNGGNVFELYDELMTVTHEMFHVFGFSSFFVENIRKQKMESHLKYLPSLKTLKYDPLVDNDAHWNPAVIVNDLMVPLSRVDAVLSVFSIEYLDNISENMITTKKDLQNNYLMDEVFDFNEFFKMDCNKKEYQIQTGEFTGNAKYDGYCTKDQLNNRAEGCDRSYIYKTKCSEYTDPTTGKRGALDNNCYEKKASKKGICINADESPSSSTPFESFGDDSRCFVDADQDDSYCIKVKLQADRIVLLVNEQRYECRVSFEKITIEYKKGSKTRKKKILCPDFDHFKKTYELGSCPSFCHANGFCSNGKCVCFDGYDSKSHCKDKLNDHDSLTRFIQAFNKKVDKDKDPDRVALMKLL